VYAVLPDRDDAAAARGVSVVVGDVAAMKDMAARPLAETESGCEWIAAYESVNGFVRIVTEVGTR